MAFPAIPALRPFTPGYGLYWVIQQAVSLYLRLARENIRQMLETDIVKRPISPLYSEGLVIKLPSTPLYGERVILHLPGHTQWFVKPSFGAVFYFASGLGQRLRKGGGGEAMFCTDSLSGAMRIGFEKKIMGGGGKVLRLTVERMRRGWTKVELGRRARISPVDVGKVENGWIKPFPAWQSRLSEALGVPAEELFREVDLREITS